MKRIIVTGGAGFIGCNTTARLMGEGWRVLVIDDLSRRGTETNLAWLETQGGFDFEQVSLTDAAATARTVSQFGEVAGVIHLAGQVAVTTSLVNPRDDFERNAFATLNVLEAIRATGRKPPVIFASTNKVYGGLENVELAERETRWECTSHPSGIVETVPLDFHTPYGCSKGAADQLVHDYARCYGIPSAVLRQSCILGRRQFGVEDQGWVAWFLIAALLGRPVTVYGDGKQVRDLLWVDDLVDLYLRLVAKGSALGAAVYNVGGSAAQTLSLRELIDMIGRLQGEPFAHAFGEPRQGDQRWFVADTARVTAETGWQPSTGVETAIRTLWDWVGENRLAIETTLAAAGESAKTGRGAMERGAAG
jgi:CDP-paratose 2-epimerase